MNTSSTPHQERDRPPHLMSDEELRQEYVQLCRMNASLNEESASLQSEISAIYEESVRFQQSTEVEEDKVANQLLRRLQSEEQQKRRLLDLIRREESSREQIMKQISQIRTEKTDLAGQMGQQESLMLQLQKKLMEVVTKTNEVKRELLKERRRYLEVLSTQLNYLKEGSLNEKNEEQRPKVGENATSNELEPMETASLKADDKIIGVTTASAAFDAASTDTNVAINHLEKQLNRLLCEHAAAVQVSTINEMLCAELAKKLGTIQQAAFLDLERASKLEEELKATKSRVAVLEHHASHRDGSVISEDSSGLPTPTLSCVNNKSLRDRTVEVLSSRQCEPSSSIQASLDESETGDGAPSSS
ncbi:hypothetical protein TraAM80_01120 [Trypanosoma rangeli]|uniref:Uncharacterized protein n=1 Tax=Trypanosoma rangeli TaxID=5698 RepID=A0A422P0F7_TRYRA|nr:uncharacterized protein TraAM80_01120 [Trypanosoma rangeli]RNF11188.1 hypothetical protein TraAM80_01120 [Trypanosoma rangeli]|eukprot:RNF11188.1 hypothetical protein TraAM80_01120 [Trypanosoma rangeli]